MARVSSKMSLHGGTDLVGADSDDLVEKPLAQTKGLNLPADRDPIGEQADMIEPDAFTGRDGLPHAGQMIWKRHYLEVQLG